MPKNEPEANVVTPSCETPKEQEMLKDPRQALQEARDYGARNAADVMKTLYNLSQTAEAEEVRRKASVDFLKFAGGEQLGSEPASPPPPAAEPAFLTGELLRRISDANDGPQEE
jgi:hypothetical protein